MQPHSGIVDREKTTEGSERKVSGKETNKRI